MQYKFAEHVIAQLLVRSSCIFNATSLHNTARYRLYIMCGTSLGFVNQASAAVDDRCPVTTGHWGQTDRWMTTHRDVTGAARSAVAVAMVGRVTRVRVDWKSSLSPWQHPRHSSSKMRLPTRRLNSPVWPSTNWQANIYIMKCFHSEYVETIEMYCPLVRFHICFHQADEFMF